ncbi:hypothetical protein NECAME_19121 [Necator americanus]|uniref:Uncharacterized protein n=1 Tax=Necator americanus TaxID=51031 RepID=W2SQB2_NECAM|nr:hypothetical protein NECAME_19121 [Necator americanus]ETN71909.1 hypothetical protein NECAME_19121 [Necator americanus]
MALSCIDTLDNPIQHHKLEELLQKFWSLESVGIIDDVSQSDGERCLQKFNDTVCFSPEEGRYMVRLPSKEDTSQLLDNFNMATSRLRSTVNTLKKHYGLLVKYHNIIKDQLQKSIIEEVKQGDTSSTCHYLPHHEVISESSKNTNYAVCKMVRLRRKERKVSTTFFSEVQCCSLK